MPIRIPKLALCALIYIPVVLGQGLSPSTPAKEYIRFNGQVVAIENAAGSSMVHIDVPAARATVSGSQTFSGWAVDPATTIASVEIMIDGAGYPNATYQVPRSDVCTNQYPGCPNVGWSTTIDTTQLADGPHTLAVTAVTSAGKRTTLTGAFATANAPYVTIDVPAANVTYSGSQTFSGWALRDGEELSGVSVTIDGTSYAANYNVARSDVCGHSQYSLSPNCPNVGWALKTALNTASLVDGPHTIAVTALDPGGNAMQPTVSVTFSTSNGRSSPTFQSVAAAVDTNGQVHLFAQATSGSPAQPSVQHNVQLSAGSFGWSGWSQLSGGQTSAPPSVIANNDGRLEVFVMGTSEPYVYHNAQKTPGGTDWTGWSIAGNNITVASSPTVIRNTDGRLQLFAQATGNGVQFTSQSSPGSSGWNDWAVFSTNSPGDTTAPPAAVCNTDGLVDVFVLSDGGNVIYNNWETSPDGGWSGWSQLPGGKVQSQPVLALNSDGRVEVFAEGTDSSVQTDYQTSPGSLNWTGWAALGSQQTVGVPAAILNPDGELEVFTISDGGNQLYHNRQTSAGGAWGTSWSLIASGDISSPTVVRNADGRVQVFYIGSGGTLNFVVETSPGSGTYAGPYTIGN